MRCVILVLAALAPSTALAAELWPTFDGSWQWALTEPVPGGLRRFGYVDAEPAGPATWKIRVTCGVEDPRTGRVVSRVVGTGTSTRARLPGFGGRFDLKGGRCGTFIITQDDRDPENLALYGEFDEGVPECPRRGVGALSSGD
ncbi:hypothetical protein [Methylobacterium gregans]|uniref:DUF2147 domain-containing protein n=1 Tax=Methylobacterium gregans TaxID=374424 RepID=A0AA37HRA5_9HYPH|nr:hypothetical protein [Methylobacterium gregans]MDQ0522469.1 hypothetical protein [Methylobacterium gregans]GJD79528.1 hypothetical protein NBEOAGPD_2757 [Methylobacterium gregans]GLS55217.1 hypothetical protein GCM10007886_34010 [Methylobacterium gregans]